MANQHHVGAVAGAAAGNGDPGMTPAPDRGLTVRAVPWDGADAAGLRGEMSAELDPRYAADEDRLGPVLAPPAAEIVLTLAAFDGARAVACGSLRALPAPVDVDGVPAAVEVKKLFVARSHRRLGLASRVLDALTAAAAGRGARAVVLHTGVLQPEAIALYHARGWRPLPAYGDYAAIADVSACFGTVLPAR